VEQAREHLESGYDSIVIGKGLTSTPDVSKLIRDIKLLEADPSLFMGGVGSLTNPFGGVR